MLSAREGASNDSGVIDNVDFQGFWALRLRFGILGNEANITIWYYLSGIISLVAFTDPKYMTLNDLESLNGHFTLKDIKVHYYEQPFEKLFLLT